MDLVLSPPSYLLSLLCFRLLLLNQFHDVLPGSCIQLVVEDALQYYTGEQGVWQGGHSSVCSSLLGLQRRQCWAARGRGSNLCRQHLQ